MPHAVQTGPRGRTGAAVDYNSGPMAEPAAYPRELERDVLLKDGTRVHLRPIRPDDAPRLQVLYDRLSRHTAYQRFFTVMKRLPPDWARILASVDYRTRLALVAERPGEHGPELIGVGRYEPTDEPGGAEVAFVVQDGWQNKGLGTVLFNAVLDAATARGIARFRAWVLTDNRRMLDLIVRFGDIKQRKTEQGVTELVFTARKR